MSDERMEEIRERLEAVPEAHRPPWTVLSWARGLSVVTEDSDPMEGPIYEVCRVPDTSIGGGDLYQVPDLIAHAPSDLRYLLDRIEAQREVVEAARELKITLEQMAQAIKEAREDGAFVMAADAWEGHGVGRDVTRFREALDTLEEQTDD